MRFEWDPEKARSNLAKHGVSFARVEEAFEDPNSITVADRVVDGELRWRTLGRVGFTTVLFVAHTLVDDDADDVVVRVISARKADRRETRAYERGDDDAFS
ncbi:BrnT family toxin [Brevundimonas sp.]|uniref:BrnT family toxin n=1 Tax=Brevundimonas sp. TaxID=1871086 RepID=UPI00378509D3